jgi:hypothetical protein
VGGEKGIAPRKTQATQSSNGVWGMRVTVAARWRTDPRRVSLAIAMGNQHTADGIALAAWWLAHEHGKNPSQCVPEDAWERSLSEQARDSLITAGLAEQRESGVYVRGTAEFVIKRKKEPKQSITTSTWTAYADSYALRYGVAPVRNATVSGQMMQFVKRVGEVAAPHVAAFYVRHNAAFYVRVQHAVGVMLKDAESLHTQWKTGRSVTQVDARAVDQQQARIEQRRRIMEGEL